MGDVTALFPRTYVIAPWLMAGPHPCAKGGDLATLLASRVTLFLDLTEAGELTAYTAQLPSGVEHARIPIPDFATPSVGTVRKILDRLDAAQAAGRTVYLHCHGGLGRTGTVAGCFLARHGWPGEHALAELQRLRAASGCDPAARSPETDGQRSRVLDWEPGT